MRNPFRRVYLWTLLTIIISFIIFYNQRGNITTVFIANFVPPLPQNWIYNEFVTGLLGGLSLFIGWFYAKIHGWHHKPEQMDKAYEQQKLKIEALSHQLDVASRQLEILNTNLDIIIDAFYKGKIPELPVKEKVKEPEIEALTA